MTVWLPSAIWAAIQFWQFIASLYVSISSGVDVYKRQIHMLEKQQIDAAMLYTSDHGEDIFDDSRHLDVYKRQFMTCMIR